MVKDVQERKMKGGKKLRDKRIRKRGEDGPGYVPLC